MLLSLFALGTLSHTLPPLPSVAIYEANLRAEGPNAGFAALNKRLNSIAALGTNVLWLMPVQPVGKERSAGGLGSPYAPANYLTINPEFGTGSDFQTLVDKAHSLKMAVIIDWVADHTAWDSPWMKAHPDWYLHDSTGNIISPPNTNWKDVAALDYQNRAMRNVMISSMASWVVRYGIDGFRCDAADLLPFDFWKEAVTRLRTSSGKPLLMLAEGFRSDHYAAGFDLTYGWHFYDKLAAIFNGEKASELAAAALSESTGVPADARRLRFITNHDKCAWDGTPIDFFKSFKGVHAATVITDLYGGTPLVYEGQEVDWSKKIPLFEQSTIDWTTNLETANWMGSLLAFRHSHPAAQEGALIDYSTDDAVVFVRRSHEDEILVMANVRNRPTSVSIPNSSLGKWVNESKVITATAERLAPYEYKIYTGSPPVH